MKKTDIAVISFTYRGAELAEHIQEAMDAVWSCKLYTKCSDARAEGIGISVDQPLAEWTGKQFAAGNALLFIGACGIAVRSIAPHVKDKLSDVPVLVADEVGQFVIPLLAGHYGGANRLAGELSRALGATAVLTTATDVNGLFAVDVFAASNRLAVAGHDGIARVSAGLLRAGYLTMSVAGECEGEIPPEVRLVPYPPKEPVDVLVAPQCEAGERCSLWLIPSCLLLGVGCRRGKSEEELEAFVRETLEKEKLSSMAVAGIASVDVKADEVGILALAEQLAVPFLTYPAGRLQCVDGTFTSSGFVAQQVGVDNVCERAAVCAAGEGGRLLVQKTACEGKTLAIAEKKWSVKF